MANLTTGQLLKVTLFCRANAQNGLNVRHYTVGATVGAPITDEEAAQELSTVIGPLYRNIMSAQASYSGLRLQVMEVIPFPYVASIAGAGVGAVAGDLMSTFTCGLVKLTTQFAGRRGRGRFYACFPGESANEEEGNPSAAYLAGLNTFMDVIMDDMVITIGANTVTLIPVLNGSNLLLPKPITGFQIRPYWASQRRRGQQNRGDVPGP
jgi:hypothetical protein